MRLAADYGARVASDRSVRAPCEPCSRRRSSTRRSPATTPATSWCSSARTIPAPTIPCYRARRNEIAAARARLGARHADPADRLHRERARGLAHGLPRARAQARALRLPRLPRGAPPRSALPARPHPAARRGHAGLEPLTGFELPARRRARAARASSTARSATASSTRRSTSATRRRRCTRPSPTSSTRSSATATCSPRPRFAEIKRAGRAGRPARRDRRGAAVPRRRVLVHDRVRRRCCEDGELRAYGAGILSLLRRDRGVPRRWRSARSTCVRWARSTTTSPSTSRCCSRADVDDAARGGASAGSSRRSTTTPRRACATPRRPPPRRTDDRGARRRGYRKQV